MKSFTGSTAMTTRGAFQGAAWPTAPRRRPRPAAIMIWTLALALVITLSGCATDSALRREPPVELFADGLFVAPPTPIDPAAAFALSDEMRRYAHTEVLRRARSQGVPAGLVEALYQSRELKLEYESAFTRNATEAFEARRGNCLSLVLMTAAFAKELGIPVRYNSALLDELWERRGDLLLRSGHVNITLGHRLGEQSRLMAETTIDFLPPEELPHLKVREIPESLVISMYLNNRAVEALVREELDQAYAFAREAVRQSPDHLAALNTLGVVFQRRGAVAHAVRVFEHVLAQDERHTRALSNLLAIHERGGNSGAALKIRERLAQLEREPPLHRLNLALAALQRDDLTKAQELLAREAARRDANAAVHYWLGFVSYRLGDHFAAQKQLRRAAETSASRSERELYTAKLNWLREQRSVH